MTPSGPDPGALFKAGRWDEADHACREWLRRDASHAPSHHLLGVIALRRGRTSEAVDALRRAVSCNPRSLASHEALAEAELRSHRLAAAEGQALRALDLVPESAGALDLLGRIAIERCDYDTAEGLLLRAARSAPGRIEPLVNLSVAYHRTGRPQQARRLCETVLRAAPDHPPALNNLGLALKALGQRSAAIAAFERAGDFAPARLNLGYTLLLEGDFERGLPLYETRLDVMGLRLQQTTPEWNGNARPSSTLLVVHEQGLGDTLMMSRFLPELTGRFGHVVLQAQPPLARLLAESFPAVRVVATGETVAHDCWIASMSLPRALGVRRAADLPTAPWLTRPRARVAPRGRLRVGINWAGNPRFAADRTRSTSLDRLALLLRVSEVDWVSLHKGYREAEADAAGLDQPLRGARDFADTADVVAGLDLVISTETAIPNLSAAMGVPTFVLAALDHDWRWTYGYRDVRVFVQETPGDWSATVVAVLEALAERLRPADRDAA